MANFWENDEVAGSQSSPRVNFWDQDALSGDPAMLESTAEPPSPEAWNPLAGLSRDVINGVPVIGPLYTGAVDAVTTQIAGMLTGEDPNAIRDRVYAKQDAYEEQNPVLSTVGQIAGGTAAMAPLGMTSVGARLLGVGQGQALASRLGMGAASGGIVSGADSLARGNSAQDAFLTSLGGAALGAAGGVSAPYIGAAIGRGGDLARRLFGFQPAVGSVPVSRPAADILTRAMTADGTLGNQAAVNMSQAGPRAMLADAGPNTMSLLDTAIARSGPGSRIAMDAVEARAAAANDDVTSALSAALGEPQGIYTTGNAIRTGSAPARHAAYEAAYASPIDYSSDAGRSIETLMQRVPQSAITAANNLMRVEGSPARQIMAQVADDGTVTFLQMPGIEQLDYITRGLNTVARGSEGTGTLGGMTDVGRAYGNLAREIRTAAREAVPAYANALETAATPIGQREALLFGSELLRPNLARDEAADIISGMTAPERRFAQQGVRAQIDEAIANVRAVSSDQNIDARQARKALQDLSSPAAREKLSLLLGRDEAQNLFRKLDEATQSLVLRANVATNSRTFARENMNNTVESYINDGAWNQILQGKPINASQSAVQAVTGRNAQGRTEIADRVYSEIAQLLVQNPDRGMDLIAGLAARQARASDPRIGSAIVPGAVNSTTQAIAELLLGNVAQ